MLKFFSGLIRRQPKSQNDVVNTSNSQTFPISQTGIESLQEQIKSALNLRLKLDDFLILVKSTIIDARKSALQLTSIADINSILDETDVASNLVFSQIGQHIPRFRYALRLEYLKQVLGLGNRFNVDAFKLLQNHSGFPAHKQLQQELVRSQIEAHLELEYGLHPCRSTQRIARHNISSISKAEYVQHCLNLLNLGLPISAETTQKMVALCQSTGLPSQLVHNLQNAHQNMVPVHVVITDLLRANLGVQGNHNTHPASRLLEFSTGFVFHPNSTTNINQLLNPNSPSAFQNIGKLLTDKYIAALASNNTRHFFENAFVQQDPCFEATVENLIEFNPEQIANTLAVPPTPKWTRLASTADNIEALLDWQELATLKSYADSNNIAVKANEHQKIEQLLGCTEFHAFIRSKKTELLGLLASLIPNGTPHQLQAQLDARWP
ncbi:hypothetical protein [Limnobacter parvus]|uniref:Uncharacterized protein n=1 Tax=Limnobacter parvus TaxID=2939690 RepID=A0ABT1XFT3_9BURK|nr:hypothetical protein [Limnobacter parvus]MCR2746138.1 hypothetical protein [Limnobacter parvus]